MGESTVDLVYVDMISHLEIIWEVPSHAVFLNRLGSFGRLIMLNQRGLGMSDSLAGAPRSNSTPLAWRARTPARHGDVRRTLWS